MPEHFENDLRKAHQFHGHICAGIVLGVRMSRIGLNYLKIEDPLDNRDFIVFVEADRCIADAVSSVTGCSLGRRRLKWFDYGKMAATFVDMNTKKGVRIKTIGNVNAPDDVDIVAYWSSIADDELFKLEPVMVNLEQEDLPGKPLRRVQCENCGESIMDGRDLMKDGKLLCKACANGAYYRPVLERDE